jgi:hypothetical protein
MMSMTSEEFLAAMQTIADKAQATTDQKFSAIQTAIDKAQATTDQKFSAIQTAIDKAQATTDQKLTAMQAATDQKLTAMQAATDQKLTAIDKRFETAQKEMIDIVRRDAQNIAEEMANKFVQRFQAILDSKKDRENQIITEGFQEILRRLPTVEKQQETTNQITTLTHSVADHSVRIKKLEEAKSEKT